MSLITTKNGEISSSAAVTFSAGVTGSLVLSSSYLILSESVNAPGTPASSKGALYASGSDGFLYWKNDAGNVYNLTETGSSGTGSVTSLNDLTDVDLTTVSPGSGNVLSYDGTSWIPVTSSGGGSSTFDPTPLFDGITFQHDDFNGYIDAFTAYSAMGWRFSNGTGGGIAVIASEAGHSGIYRLTTGTGTTTFSSLRSGPAGANAIALSGSTRIVFESEVRLQNDPDGTDDFIFEFGFSDDMGDGGAQFNYVGFKIDRTLSTTNWYTETERTGSTTTTDTSVAFAANTWFTLRFDVNEDATEILFYIDNALVATQTGNIPDSSMSYGWQIRKVAGTVAAAVDIDSVTLEMKRGDVTTSGGAGGGGSLTDGDYGDITVSSSGSVMTIDNGVVTPAKMADIATDTFIGRTTAGTGVPEVLTTTQATENINVFTTSLKGLAPASGGGTTNFLRADGTWDVPPTGSGGTGSVTSLDDLSDVDLTTTSPISGNILSYDGANWIPITASTGGTGSVTSLDDLSDVDLTTTSPGSGNVLSYDGTSWIPVTSSATAGSGSTTINPTPLFDGITWQHDDFNGYIDAFTAFSAMGWRASTTSGGSVSVVASEAGHSGIYQINTGTGATAAYALRSGPVGANAVAVSGSTKIIWETEIRLRDLPDGTNDFIVESGFSDDMADGGSIFDAILFRVIRSINTTNWIATTLSSGTATNTDSGVAFTSGASEWVTLRFEVAADGGTVEFFIDNVSVATHTTNIPTASMSFGVCLRKVAGSVAATVEIDSITLGMIREELTISVGGQITDGDYGDITVSGTGSVMTIDANVVALDDLSDVDLTTTTPISGNMLSYDGTDWIPVVTGSSGGASALNDLSDVDLTTTSPVSGNVLSYDGTDWIPSPAVSGSGAGDVTGPGTVLDQEIVRFNGTTGKIIEGAGVRHYGASATDPSSPTPQAGDEYYNTAINHKMVYDGTRSKWLSITTLWDGAGRSGTTGASSFYRRFNGMVMTATVGSVLPKCTIIGINFDANAVTHTLEVLVGGVAVAELASGGAATVSDYTIDVDVAEGIFACRNKAASATTTNLQCTVYYKLRA